MGGVEIGVVQGVDVGDQGLAEGLRQALAVGDGRDASQSPADAGQAAGVDGGLIQIGLVEIPDQLLVRARRRRRAGRLLDQLADPGVGLLGEHGAQTVAGAVGRNLDGLEPSAVRVAEEIVAWLHRPVHAGEVDPMRGRRGRRADCGDQQEDGGETEGVVHARVPGLAHVNPPWRRSESAHTGRLAPPDVT